MQHDFSTMSVEEMYAAKSQLDKLLEEKARERKNLGVQKVREIISAYGLTMADIAQSSLPPLMKGDVIYSGEMGMPSILEILSSVSLAATVTEIQKIESKGDDKNRSESRFPIVIASRTREYFDVQCAVLGMSLASLCGTILNEVAKESMRRVSNNVLK